MVNDSDARPGHGDDQETGIDPRNERWGEISFQAGEECRECGDPIAPNETDRPCHTCRTRPHRAEIDEMVDKIITVADTRQQATSIAHEVRQGVAEHV